MKQQCRNDQLLMRGLHAATIRVGLFSNSNLLSYLRVYFISVPLREASTAAVLEDRMGGLLFSNPVFAKQDHS